MEVTDLTVAQLSEKLVKRELSSEEITRQFLNRIERLNPKLGAYITFCPDVALEMAKTADLRMAKGDRVGPLTGVPIALKDIFITKGVLTTCASNILKNYVPPFDGTHSLRLKNAGAVLLGKLNMDEFAMGSSNEFSAFGTVKNPWAVGHVPGGSSGGSACAVAASLCIASLGTDTGGSIRYPASHCGIVGMKPTYGRVTRYGMVAFASSLDQAGPMTKTVRDCAILLNTIAGFDPNDSTSLNLPVPNYTGFLGKKVCGLKLGLPKEYFVEGVNPEVSKAVIEASKVYESLGAKLVHVTLPHTRYAVPTYYIIAPAEASANLARYDGIRYGHRSKQKDLVSLYRKSRTEGFGPEVTLRIILGTFVLSSGYYDAYYLRAQKVRTLIKNDFLQAFEKCDALLAPVAPEPAFKLGERIDDPIKMYLSDIFTIPVNLAGLPALALPCGFSGERRGHPPLPIGMQLIGRPLSEGTLFQIGYAYEQETKWHLKRPSL